MAAIAYVNGRYLPLHQASVNIEDRGYQFGDGIYEVLFAHRGRLIDAKLHLARLERSLAEVEIAAPMRASSLGAVISELLARNRAQTALIYIQITRGVARRDHAFPHPHVPPSLVITVRRKPLPPADLGAWGVGAITLPDERWARCDIKSTNLLPNVLAKEAARRAGAFEAILLDEQGLVREAASSTVWAVTAGGVLVTRPLDQHILPGCTRAALLELLGELNVRFEERALAQDELRQAREIFITSATSFVKPVLKLDGLPVGQARPGPVSEALYASYRARFGE